MKQWAKEWAGQ